MNKQSDRDIAVKGTVYYADPAEQPLFFYAGSVPVGESETNIEFHPRRVAIRDVRRSGGAPRLEVEGAAVFEHRSAVRSFYDEAELRRVGYAEAADIVRAATGAAEVVVFDHNVRRSTVGRQSAEHQLAASPPCAHKRPVFHIHTDFTARSAPIRASTVLGAELGSARRIAELNVWRPIAGPVRDSPLAFCDASSVAPGDLVPAELRYPDRIGEIYYVRFNPAHRWYYLPQMRTDEVWVFKNYDAATDGRARFTPHTAFLEPLQHGEIPARESIEFRAFAIFAD
jgi:hypothetical protein